LVAACRKAAHRGTISTLPPRSTVAASGILVFLGSDLSAATTKWLLNSRVRDCIIGPLPGFDCPVPEIVRSGNVEVESKQSVEGGALLQAALEPKALTAAAVAMIRHNHIPISYSCVGGVEPRTLASTEEHALSSRSLLRRGCRFYAQLTTASCPQLPSVQGKIKSANEDARNTQNGCGDIGIDKLIHIVKQKPALIGLDASLGFEPVLQ